LGSIAETEEEIRELLKQIFQIILTILKNLKIIRLCQVFRNSGRTGSEVRNQYFQSSTKDFKTFLKAQRFYCGRIQNTAQKIQIEKYAPVKSEEGIDELYENNC
jgi:hypothetical protein